MHGKRTCTPTTILSLPDPYIIYEALVAGGWRLGAQARAFNLCGAGGIPRMLQRRGGSPRAQAQASCRGWLVVVRNAEPELAAFPSRTPGVLPVPVSTATANRGRHRAIHWHERHTAAPWPSPLKPAFTRESVHTRAFTHPPLILQQGQGDLV